MMNEQNDQIKKLLSNLLQSRHPKFSLPFVFGNGKIVDIPILYITNVEAYGDVSIIHFENYKKRKITTSFNIGTCEKLLKDYGFFRIHRTYLLNLSYLDVIIKTDNKYFCKLQGGKELALSRRRKKDFLKFCKDLNITV